MLHFDLSDEQRALQEEARRFSKKEIKPVAIDLDESSKFPENIINKAADLGFTNLSISSDYGGTGLGLVDSCLVIEEIAWGCAGVSTSMVANDLALTPIQIGGNDRQKEQFIGDLIANKKLASFCLTEPGAGSDAASISTSMVRDGDNYIINGAKQWITNGGYSSQFTVFATIEKAKGYKGICCIVVPSDLPGITIGHHENKMGQRCSNTVAITFDNVKVPVGNRIGEEGEGFKIAMKTLDHSRPLTAIVAVGNARAAFEYARAYSVERKQFGRSIADFQAIQFMLADMATEIDAARLLTLRSAQMLDEGRRATLESSMAKRYAADIGMKVTTDAVQIYGGYGYTKEFPVEKCMRDAKLMQIYEGTSQIQRIVIARELLKEV